MRRRLPVVAFVLYVALDVSVPLMPGALEITADKSVVAVQADPDLRAAAAPARAATRDRDRLGIRARRPTVPRAPVRRVVSDWLAADRTMPSDTPPAPSSVDDH